ncbi:ribosomal L27 protein-domain-containing protein [Annulohypoxylon truncatum]|uniref:ribosomal L27 protein-domain-containing protein n=1 Tax=Annulohypoxylon truncatum TaxID=327061 RepID=UPI002008E15E|nr:ribosomal L27 protein-domain-containing protein [Annulohypoxylon truncatum]KAI1206892.1 ribosomal L27 protein-domain-containing protein [Annulohypoxylon truncatum]
MRIAQLQQPIAAAASGLGKTATTTTIRQLRDALGQLRIGASNAAVEGRRHASHQSQGAYRLKDTSTIPKKLGAKKTGDNFVIPGNIIFKQRGTKWFPGENCDMGRDHTIHATATGYVKYYRDPAKHPKRQYIGVVFNKEDTLPYPQHAMRKRRLNMVAVPLAPPPPPPELSASGIPTQVVRQGEGRKPHPRDERVMKLREDRSYAYAEESWRLGTLVRTEKRKMGSRRVAMRHRRRKAKAIALEMRAEREDKIARRKEALDAQRKARAKRMREYRERRKAEQEAEAAGQGKGGGVPPAGESAPEPPRVDA